jgi:hypothetical protein
MNIQMNANQKKKTTIDHSTVPNVHSTALMVGRAHARGIIPGG